MKITIEIDSKNELDKLSALFETLDINMVKVFDEDALQIPLSKGDKTIDPKGLFGIWADKPRDIETIRKAAWHR